MKLQITPLPSEEERAAIEAALGQEALEKGPSVWADQLLPWREDDPDPYP